MAAGVPGANRGGNHVFMDDPEGAGIAKAVNDQGAVLLQITHFLESLAHNDDKPRVAAIADIQRQILRASELSSTREKNTRELVPLSRFPDAGFGAQGNINTIRLNGIAFNGQSDDPNEIIRWLAKIKSLGQGHQLTGPAIINLMLQTSSLGAADYIEQMRDEGKTLIQVVQQLEMRYAGLCIPEEARVKCNMMQRKTNEGEKLGSYIDRLRFMARMACRLEEDDARRIQAMDTLVEANIKRVLPPTVRMILDERIVARSRIGLPAFTARELEHECLDLEARREERKTDLKKEEKIRKINAKQFSSKIAARKLRRMELEEVRNFTENSESSGTSSTSSDEEENDDGQEEHLIREIKFQRDKYAQRGRKVNDQKIYQKAFKEYERKFPPPKFNKKNAFGARQAQGVIPPMPRQPGPPNKLPMDHNMGTLELLSLANCQKGQCIQCGIEGHYRRADQCALRCKLLTDRPCAKCGFGLHAADDCVRTHMGKYQTQLQQEPAQAVQQVQDLMGKVTLNE